eukprot:snap_masked-scaffold_80-processed-gene-0.22-mRNA-1 protein AED:1.00 eAED:1.00 QI:0/-1/0/0/-1/1/1/0/393
MQFTKKLNLRRFKFGKKSKSAAIEKTQEEISFGRKQILACQWSIEYLTKYVKDLEKNEQSRGKSDFEGLFRVPGLNSAVTELFILLNSENCRAFNVKQILSKRIEEPFPNGLSSTEETELKLNEKANIVSSFVKQLIKSSPNEIFSYKFCSKNINSNSLEKELIKEMTMNFSKHIGVESFPQPKDKYIFFECILSLFSLLKLISTLKGIFRMDSCDLFTLFIPTFCFRKANEDINDLGHFISISKSLTQKKEKKNYYYLEVLIFNGGELQKYFKTKNQEYLLNLLNKTTEENFNLFDNNIQILDRFYSKPNLDKSFSVGIKVEKNEIDDVIINTKLMSLLKSVKEEEDVKDKIKELDLSKEEKEIAKRIFSSMQHDNSKAMEIVKTLEKTYKV